MFTHPRERFGFQNTDMMGEMEQGSSGSLKKTKKKQDLCFLVTTPFSHLKQGWIKVFYEARMAGKR